MRPWRCSMAPVKAPFSCPNSSDAISIDGIDAQFTLVNTWLERDERLCIARAISSFPVPVSPVIRTVESVGATFKLNGRTNQLRCLKACVAIYIAGSQLAAKEPLRSGHDAWVQVWVQVKKGKMAPISRKRHQIGHLDF